MTAETSDAATLRLWALTSEMESGITTPSVYRHAGSGVWNELTTGASFGTVGAYTYAESDTSGFSHFLIAELGSNPTAISLQSFTGASTVSSLIPIAGLLFVAGVGITLMRKKKHKKIIH